MLQQLRHQINDTRQNIYASWRKWKLRKAMQPREYEHLLPTVEISKKWHGSQYGGFYVHPDLLNSDSIIYSIGLGKDISFGLSMIKAYGCKIFGFDPTPKSLDWLATQSLPAGYTYEAWGLSAEDADDVPFYLPDNPRQVSGSLLELEHMQQKKHVLVNMRSLKTMTDHFGHSQIDVLKMDIEGAEYELIPSILSSGIRIGQFLIEFHDRMMPDREAHSKHAISQLKAAGFEVFAHSWHFEEISLLHRDALKLKP